MKPSALLLVWIIFFFTACETTQGPVSKSIPRNVASNNLLQEANEYYNAGVYQTALLKYSSYVYSPFPDKRELAYAHFRIGACNYYLGQYADASATLRSFMANYPGHALTGEARELYDKSNLHLEQNRQVVLENQKSLQRQIQEKQKAMEQDPGNAARHYDLANLYWENAQFNEALHEYDATIRLNREYEQDGLIRQRVRIDEQGKLVSRDALEEYREGVVRIRNSVMDVRERSDWLGASEQIHISGAVENTGIRDVRNVRVVVTLYGFFEDVQDTQTVNVGRLRAGESQPFAVLMDRYTGAARNIPKYSTKVMYDE